MFSSDLQRCPYEPELFHPQLNSLMPNMPIFTDLSPYIVIMVHVMFCCQFLVALYVTEQTAVL